MKINMDYQTYVESLKAETPPEGVTPGLQAMWYDGKGDWETAHQIAQEIESKSGSLVHAYLHRKEGDTGNARYWYAAARAKFPETTLDEEWREIVTVLLKAG